MTLRENSSFLTFCSVSDHDMNASGFSQTRADGDEAPAKIPRGRRKGAAQLQRKQTGTNEREL